MAEETPAAVTVVTASPAVVEAAPVTAAAAPVVQEPAVVVTAPVVEAAPEVKTEALVEAVKPLLCTEDAKTESPKTDEVKTEAEAPKVEPTPLPVYEFKLPEGANADNPVFKTFQSKLGEFQNLTKAEQTVVQKLGQEFIDMHQADVKAIVESQNKGAWDWFNKRNADWLDSAKKDPVIGGDNFDATVNSASQAVRLYGGNKTQQIETAKLLQETGLENSPVMLRFLSNITKVAAKEGEPVSGTTVPTQKAGIAELMYGGKKTA